MKDLASQKPTLTLKDIERMIQETPARLERALKLLAASRALTQADPQAETL